MDMNDRTINITGVDVEAQNGVVHVIDKVILPKQVQTGINMVEDFVWKVYPNPANGFVQIDSDSEGTLRIRDITGRTMVERRIEASVERIDLGDYKSGIYFVSLQRGEEISTQKLIVR